MVQACQASGNVLTPKQMEQQGQALQGSCLETTPFSQNLQPQLSAALLTRVLTSPSPGQELLVCHTSFQPRVSPHRLLPPQKYSNIAGCSSH